MGFRLKHPSEMEMRTLGGAISACWDGVKEGFAGVPSGLHALLFLVLMPILWPLVYIVVLCRNRRKTSR